MEESSIDLGTGDVGVLNYAYALNSWKLISTKVVNNFYSGISSIEKEFLQIFIIMKYSQRFL
jgi:hypothetical protein